MNELALFAGAGGGILGGVLLGWRNVCAVEINPYARSVLLARQRDGLLPRFPIWDDIKTFTGKQWRGSVDVVTGGFPCQDISVAGTCKGLDGARSGLWKEMGRIIGEVRPKFALVENSPMLVIRGLSRILGDFSEMGYDARWGIISAKDADLDHIRERIWILAHARGVIGTDWNVVSKDCRNLTCGRRFEKEWSKDRKFTEMGTEALSRLGEEWTKGNSKPANDGIVNGLAGQLDRLKAIGNGQVPAVVKLAWETLSQ